MKVRPNLAYRHANYPSNTALDPKAVIDATPATNQPNWECEGKIFVECPNGAPELLLVAGEYTIVEPFTEEEI
jgi:hypothetical protein